MSVNASIFGRNVGETIRFTSNYVNSHIVLANVEEKEAVVAGYNTVVINSTAPIYVKLGDSSTVATVPGDIADGTASELNPTSYALKQEQTHISIISPSNCVVTFAYYNITS